ncbi:MAG: RsmD family RNA methyltransferase [Planctomycetaceae bacterium]|nr:RsmD family RNA methyltransferase [Planctomycetaceae bacterium]
MARKNQRRPQPPAREPGDAGPGTVRIVGGEFRGRKLRYSGDERTRPMKDRVREAVFNLLTTSVKGTHAIDLFAGTGALAFEALSRGAERATLIECHFPTVAVIRENARTLQVEERVEIVGADTFYWIAHHADLGPLPQTIFVAPPYEFFVTRADEMRALIARCLTEAPSGSRIMVESDSRFDTGELPDAEQWDVREYPPAVVSIYRKPASTSPSAAPA